MSKKLLAMFVAGVCSVAAGGCAGRHGAVDSNVRVDPHHGREFETGFTALGNVLAPYSKRKGADLEQRQRALGSYGTLMDLVGPGPR